METVTVCSILSTLLGCVAWVKHDMDLAVAIEIEFLYVNVCACESENDMWFQLLSSHME